MTFKFTNLKTIILVSAFICICNLAFCQTVTANVGTCTGGGSVTLEFLDSDGGSPPRNSYAVHAGNEIYYTLIFIEPNWILIKQENDSEGNPFLTNIASSSVASAPNPPSLSLGNWIGLNGCPAVTQMEGSGTQNFVLPVKLLSFDGKTSSNAISLNWTTASEVNNSHFDIERSVDGINFTSITKVRGNGTTELVKAYTTQDKSPIAGINYYRLKQVDYDGQSSFSDIISVSYDKNDLAAKIIYPNPALSEININVKAETSIVISDIFGRIVKKTTVDSNKNNVNISDLNPGMYMVTIGNQASVKLIKE